MDGESESNMSIAGISGQSSYDAWKTTPPEPSAADQRAADRADDLASGLLLAAERANGWCNAGEFSLQAEGEFDGDHIRLSTPDIVRLDSRATDADVATMYRRLADELDDRSRRQVPGDVSRAMAAQIVADHKERIDGDKTYRDGRERLAALVGALQFQIALMIERA